ncbi:MAG: prepilin-type N-terminal cleavage/methylation domain-containing protein [Candidatus Omnitrophota bacterium]|jgi:prepilin-type N-terminal cleavage/methylation domain-containing protein|nr:MAG: prepilin-type N-terminal cleavage/methylation domain-containing protein [Candidatus Omnitrophota bacterium]
MKSAFTLIELLIVVAIIGILAAIAVPNFLNARLKAQIARVEAELRAIDEAYTTYRLDNNSYPPHADRCKAQHKFITTPIAYLSTSLIDPFQIQGETMTWEWFCGQYHAEPSAVEGAARIGQAAPEYWNRNRTAAFFLKSVGPDKDGQIAGGAEFFLPYDISNGLTSKGTIYRPIFGGGVSAGYPYAQGQYPGVSLADFGCAGTCEG